MYVREKTKMGYDATKGKEEPTIPADTIVDGVVKEVKDGKVKDFVKNLAKWNNPEQQVIQVCMNVLHNDRDFSFDMIFSYSEKDGQTVYSPNSALGKYKKKYNKLPEVGDQVKAMTNSEGFLRLKLD